MTDEWDDSVVSGVKPAFASKLLNLREGRALERRKTQHKVGWWGWRPVKNGVAHDVEARGLGYILPRSASMRITYRGIPEL